MKPVIELEGYRIVEINYKRNTESSDNNVFTPKFKFGLNEDNTRGQVIIEANVNDIDNHREIFVSLEGQFKINKEELGEDDDRIQETLALNGTSILFPYLRSTVSFVSTMDSQDAIVIPTVNVFEVLKNSKQ